MLPVTVAWLTLKELLSAALGMAAALALNCLPVPAMLTCSPEKVAVPLPEAVPISSEVVPRSEPVPALTLTRGARHLVFLRGGRTLLFLQGEIQHKNLWEIDLASGAKRQLTNVGPDFDIGDFDVSADGREVVLERVQERSDVVLLDLARP